MDRGGTDTSKPSSLRVIAGLIAAMACAFSLLALHAAGAAAVTSCRNADATIDDSGRTLRRALTCLINEKRARDERHVLDPNGKLEEAATKHNKAMARENCWEHECPGEPSLGKRVRDSGYLHGARRWRYAESFGCATTPQQMFDSWLGTDYNRENIRNPVFRDIGVGVLKDQIRASACDSGNEVTFTVVFGRRKL